MSATTTDIPADVRHAAPMDTVNIALLEAALAEIEQLRRYAAYEVLATQAHDTYATFPKSRRAPLAEQVEILTACAQGRTAESVAHVKFADLADALRQCGASTTLTAAAWEAEGPGRQRSGDGQQVPLKAYSLALDEIWRLRRAFAYVAGISRGHGALKTFPRSRRPQLEAQVERLAGCARGETFRAYATASRLSMSTASLEVRAAVPLTATAWLTRLALTRSV